MSPVYTAWLGEETGGQGASQWLPDNLLVDPNAANWSPITDR